VQDTISPLAKREAALSDTAGVYVNAGVDASEYYESLANDIRQHLCDPFPVSAVVTPPGFVNIDLGSRFSGLCLAHNAGYWLVYHTEQDQFYCFWGTNIGNLGARGVSGSPLRCWSA